jgi:hypothetical protein
MQTCAYCGYLAVGYWRGGGLFVCSECWAQQEEQRAQCPELDAQEEESEDAAGPEGVPAALEAAAPTLDRAAQAVLKLCHLVLCLERERTAA